MRTEHTEEQFNPNEPAFIEGQKEYAVRSAVRDMIESGNANRAQEIVREEIERGARHG